MNECQKSCGECNFGEACSADQSQCLSSSQCTAITLKDLVQTENSQPGSGFLDYTAEYTPNGGSSKNHFSLKISKPSSPLTIDFSYYPFDTCTLDKPTNQYGICAFIKEYTGDLITRLYYPQSGFLHIPTVNANGSFTATVPYGQPIFVEVDMTTGAPVPNGQCFRITNNPINAKAK